MIFLTANAFFVSVIAFFPRVSFLSAFRADCVLLWFGALVSVVILDFVAFKAHHGSSTPYVFQGWYLALGTDTAVETWLLTFKIGLYLDTADTNFVQPLS